ncbi:MAG: ATP-binding protein [Patescibacteria group bacterium]|nr:ATP-binding protein [Patescibacteria group bacterium]
MEEKIYKRKIFDEIVQYLETRNIVVIHGARQVGKTYLLYDIEKYLKKKNKKTFYLDLEDSRVLEILNQGVESFLNFLKAEGASFDKKTYVLIDEIQYLENPSSFLKLIYDHYPYLQLIVSGSSSFEIRSKFKDSLVGRTVNFELFPLSFQEFLVFKEKKIDLKTKLTTYHLDLLINYYHEYLWYGGYPKIVLEPDVNKKEKYLQQIIDTYIKKDIRDLANIKEIHKFNQLIKILASQSGQLLNIAEISRVISLSKQTIENYLFLLENTYIIKLISPYSTSAKIEVSKKPKIFFYDSGILQMLVFKKLTQSFLGSVFETSIFSQLVKKYGRKNIFYWRNKNQKEVDFIIHKKDKLIPVEAKLNFTGFNLRTMGAFCRKYKIKDFVIVGLGKEKDREYYKWPWEI